MDTTRDPPPPAPFPRGRMGNDGTRHSGRQPVPPAPATIRVAHARRQPGSVGGSPPFVPPCLPAFPLLSSAAMSTENTGITNCLLGQLRSGRRAVGTVCVLGSVPAMEVAAVSGFDFVLVDGQHGELDHLLIGQALRALDAASCHAIARPADHDPAMIQRLLDMGYQSLLLPMVNTAAEAEAIVRAACYPPRGERSQASCRATVRFGPTYRNSINDHLLLLAMVETTESLAQVEAIAATEGVAGCFIGTTDLASSMGIAPAADGPPSLERAIEAILQASRAAGKVAAIATPDGATARRRIEQGFQVVALGTDLRMLTSAFREARAGLGADAR